MSTLPLYLARTLVTKRTGQAYRCDQTLNMDAQTHTIETLHLRVLFVLAVLLSLGFASLLTVEHEAEHNDDVSNSCAHRQPNGLDHLIGSSVIVCQRVLHGLLYNHKHTNHTINTERATDTNQLIHSLVMEKYGDTAGKEMQVKCYLPE